MSVIYEFIIFKANKGKTQLYSSGTECFDLFLTISGPVPEEFNEILASFTQKGMRVLAVGHRTIDLAWHKTDRIERCVLLWCESLGHACACMCTGTWWSVTLSLED